jgi:hypothetical protein
LIVLNCKTVAAVDGMSHHVDIRAWLRGGAGTRRMEGCRRRKQELSDLEARGES